MTWEEELRKQSVALAYKVLPLPSGCDNCWGDLYQGCSDACRQSSDKHHEKVMLLVDGIKAVCEQRESSAKNELRAELVEKIEGIMCRCRCERNNVIDEVLKVIQEEGV